MYMEGKSNKVLRGEHLQWTKCRERSIKWKIEGYPPNKNKYYHNVTIINVYAPIGEARCKENSKEKVVVLCGKIPNMIYYKK